MSMSIYDEGNIIRCKTMNLIVRRLTAKHTCTEVCTFGGNGSACHISKLYKELGVKSIACKDLVGTCYFEKIKGGV